MTDIVAQQGAVASLVALARSPVAARALRAAGILATLLFLLRFWAKKGSKSARVVVKFVTDLNKVGRKVKKDDRDYDHEEYDVIVVGGGTSYRPFPPNCRHQNNLLMSPCAYFWNFHLVLQELPGACWPLEFQKTPRFVFCFLRPARGMELPAFTQQSVAVIERIFAVI